MKRHQTGWVWPRRPWTPSEFTEVRSPEIYAELASEWERIHPPRPESVSYETLCGKGRVLVVLTDALPRYNDDLPESPTRCAGQESHSLH